MPPTNSPGSSLAGSLEGTPDTRLTAFSPEDGRVPKNVGTATATPQKPGNQHDPFVSATKPKLEQKLSATASSFKPYTLRTNISGIEAQVTHHEPIPGSAAHLANIIATATASEPIEPEITSSGVFTTSTMKTRNLRIWSSTQLNRDVMPVIETSLKNLERSGYKLKGDYRIATAGADIYLRLANIDDVALVFSALQSSGELAIEYISPEKFGQIIAPQNGIIYSNHDGVIMLRVPYAAKSPQFTKKQFGEMLLDLLSVEGNLCAWTRYNDPGSLHLVAEFADSSMASRAIQRLNGQVIGDGLHALTVVIYQPDIAGNGIQAQFITPLQTPTRHAGQPFDLTHAISRLGVSSRGIDDSMSPMHSGMLSGYNQVSSYIMPMGIHPAYLQSAQQLQLGGFTTLPSAFVYSPQDALPQIGFNSPQELRHCNDFSPLQNRDARRQPRTTTQSRNRGHANNANNHHNHVDIDRIRAGSDVRTTVMLRNIPNKVDQAMLKAIVDESSFGRYDFMYLRIDFSNNCNVGYAFINFCDPLDIIEFVMIRANKPWDTFKSDKIAEVSYATIQGRDCLIQKFRNSSVMLEPPHYRPKLFFTFNDSIGRVGEEDVFPASDNASKLKRSCENAEHVGLFAPSAGQHMRDEQRRRRSQYDRGTSLAQLDEHGEEYFDPGFGSFSPYQEHFS